MNAIVLTPVVVTARDGSGLRMPSKVASCGKCGNEAFYVFQVAHAVGEEEHQHLQCTDCSETYCCPLKPTAEFKDK